jgi:multiple sugar transport system permease protein
MDDGAADMREAAVRAEARAGWAMTAPALTAIGLFFVVPAVASLVLSFTDFDIYALADLNNLRFIGLENYERLLTNPLFWKAMGNTLWFVVLGVPLIVILSLAAALLVHARTLKWRAIWRVALFAPFVTTLVATAVVWNYLLHTRYGLINYGLSLIGVGPVDWLGNPRTALPAILLFVAWKGFGYNMIIFLAALQTVNKDLLDAARVDGAGPWMRFRHVVLPAISPTILLVAILTVSGMFQLFAEPYVMTQGGPAKSTITVLYFMFEEGFKWWNLGSGAAVAFILFLCIFATTLVQMKLARRSGAI